MCIIINRDRDLQYIDHLEIKKEKAQTNEAALKQRNNIKGRFIKSVYEIKMCV